MRMRMRIIERTIYNDSDNNNDKKSNAETQKWKGKEVRRIDKTITQHKLSEVLS